MTTILILALFLSGCGAKWLSAETEAVYMISPDGKTLSYKSTKEQQGMKARFNPKTGEFVVEVDKAGTSESVLNAMVQQQILMGELLPRLWPLLEKAATLK